MKPDKVLCCRFLFAFLALTLRKTPGISTVLQSSGHVGESTGRDLVLALQGVFRALTERATRGSGGMLPRRKFSKMNTRKPALFPAFLETKYQFPRQGCNSLKFSLKSITIFNENGDGGGRMATTEFMTTEGELNCSILLSYSQ